ncbi:MAG: FAD:protein FMN transferase [Bacteroidota bacterium]
MQSFTTTLLVCLVLLLGFGACQNAEAPPAMKTTVVEGKTMGTYYRVKYRDAENRDFKAVFDSLLVAINLEVSTYIPNSTISTFNRSADTFDLAYNPNTQGLDYFNKHFITNFKAAQEIVAATDAYFDPTVMPLVNYWGFGYTEKKPVTNVDSLAIDSLNQFIGMDKVELIGGAHSMLLVKKEASTQLDFSAIAKGYAVDQLGEILSEAGITDFLVDIGGETVARGNSERGGPWRLGINVPKEEAAINDIEVIVPLKDQGLATSGNYRNFYEVAGKKYSHTINPKTGFPERSTLLSASVFAKDCMTADGYATGFMVLGLERSMQLATQIEGIEACFIYSKPDGQLDIQYTPALASIFEK